MNSLKMSKGYNENPWIGEEETILWPKKDKKTTTFYKTLKTEKINMEQYEPHRSYLIQSLCINIFK